MPARPPGRRRAAGLAGSLVVVLAGWNNLLVPRLPEGATPYAAVNLTAAGVLLATGRAAGASWAELGLARGRLGLGARWGSAAAAPVAAGYLLALAAPTLRPLLRDARITGLGAGDLAVQVLVRIPLGTVLWEEVAFRGVLPALLGRLLPAPVATGIASGVFGLWHVRPTLDAVALNRPAAGPAVRAGAVLAACLGTAAAGVLFSWLRRRSGSLLAPVLLHLATNCLGALAAAAAARPVGRDRRGGQDPMLAITCLMRV